MKKNLILLSIIVSIASIVIVAPSEAKQEAHTKEIIAMTKLVISKFPEFREKTQLISFQKLNNSIIERVENEKGEVIAREAWIKNQWVVYFRSEDNSSPNWYSACFIIDEKSKEFKKLEGLLTIGRKSSKLYPAVNKTQKKNREKRLKQQSDTNFFLIIGN